MAPTMLGNSQRSSKSLAIFSQADTLDGALMWPASLHLSQIVLQASLRAVFLLFLKMNEPMNQIMVWRVPNFPTV